MTQLAQIQTNEQLHFNKPFILVTRVGENVSNDAYHNPYQKYYECDSVKQAFKSCDYLGRDEKPIGLLRVKDERDEFNAQKTDYFHNFTTALDEYKRGIRVDM